MIALLAIILSSVSIAANVWIMRRWFVCWFKGHDRVRVIYWRPDGNQVALPPECRRCGL